MITNYNDNVLGDDQISENSEQSPLKSSSKEISETKKKHPVPGLDFGFLGRIKNEKFNKEIHIKNFDLQLERELSLLELLQIRSSNYDSKAGLYDTPGLTTFGFDDVLFHKDMEKKFRMVDD